MTPDDDMVADFLESHPDFFLEREDLLQGMQLPHGDKGSISLVEKQVEVLRERQKKSRRQLKELLNSAERNNDIFTNVRKLVLALISAGRGKEFFDALEKSLKKDFGCKAYSLIVFGDRPKQINHFTSRVSAESAREYVGALMKARAPTLGVLRPREQDFLFRHQSERVKSAAVLMIRERNRNPCHAGVWQLRSGLLFIRHGHTVHQLHC